MMGNRDVPLMAAGVHGESIPLGARIIRIADSYDAGINQVAGNCAKPPETVAGELLAGKGTLYDPTLVDVFLSTLKHLQLARSRRS